ncbi:MAG: hypothetical protein IPF45_07375 [Thermomonas sp.]|nr:hypothetical protein [Thermomonas sp.]
MASAWIDATVMADHPARDPANRASTPSRPGNSSAGNNSRRETSPPMPVEWTTCSSPRAGSTASHASAAARNNPAASSGTGRNAASPTCWPYAARVNIAMPSTSSASPWRRRRQAPSRRSAPSRPSNKRPHAVSGDIRPAMPLVMAASGSGNQRSLARATPARSACRLAAPATAIATDNSTETAGHGTRRASLASTSPASRNPRAASGFSTIPGSRPRSRPSDGCQSSSTSSAKPAIPSPTRRTNTRPHGRDCGKASGGVSGAWSMQQG